MYSLKRILVVTAVDVEKEAVELGLANHQSFNVMAAGVGPIASAVNTAKVLAVKNYDLVVSAGIGGAFYGKAELGTLVVSDEIISADLGVESPEGFCSLDELGFGSTRILVDNNLVACLMEKLQAKGILVTKGPVLTVSTVTGTTESADELRKRVPNATAEAMEGYGVALATQAYGIPVVEIRAISNLVGPRDREAWKIKEALEALTLASSILPEVLL